MSIQLIVINIEMDVKLCILLELFANGGIVQFPLYPRLQVFTYIESHVLQVSIARLNN